ncbi:MAG: dihydrodipicolinate synthase family protein [Kiritimatiellae bacterium]|nr:dihydrodipicolinate synthase family protein [Kiritimatiellia bacterium]MBQ3342734.1 dihydrodipicolinate synthase family protein [Kiritimatiellia bacterium]MBQ6330162.1 dihydrodipicolinate synthase family protein [Kiritimatiellia bacterium]
MKSDAKKLGPSEVAGGMDGVYSAMITPFTKDDKVNEGAIDQLVEYGIESGLRGFYLTGGTGEFTLMTVEERKQVFRRAAKAAKGRCKLIAHVGATRTDDAVELARYAEKVGCDWVSSVAPIYFGQSAAAQYAHYKMISEASGLPLMIYCFGNTLVPERDLKLFDLKNVKGMKYTGSDYYAVQSMRRRIGKETFFVSGRDEMLGCALALGDTFQGGIGTSYNMIPKHFVAIYEAARKGDGATVARLQCEVNQAIDLLLSCPNWSCWKAFMLVRGIDVGCARMPCGPTIPERERRAWAKKFSDLIKTFTLQ